MSFYDIKIYDKEGEKETLRDLSHYMTKTLSDVFRRHGVDFCIREITDDGTGVKKYYGKNEFEEDEE